MLSVGEGASKEALEQIRKLGSNNIIISSAKSAEEEQASTQHSHMSIYGLTYQDHALELRVVGTTANWFELVPREIIGGRVILPADQDKQAPVAVLTEFGARKILATESTIGQTIRIGGDSFEVIGIVKSESGQAGNIQIPDQEVDVYIPIEVAKKYFGDVFTKYTSGSRRSHGRRDRGDAGPVSQEEGLHGQRPAGAAQAGRGDQAKVQHRPRLHRRDQSAGRRNRDHEHHARLRDRTYP